MLISGPSSIGNNNNSPITDEISWSIDIRYCGVQLYFVIKVLNFVRLLCYLSPLILSFSFSRTISWSIPSTARLVFICSFFVLYFILELNIVLIQLLVKCTQLYRRVCPYVRKHFR